MQIQQQQSIEGPLIFASASLQFPDVLKAVRSTIRDEVRWQVRERNVCHLLIVKLIRFLLALVSASPHATPLAMSVVNESQSIVFSSVWSSRTEFGFVRCKSVWVLLEALLFDSFNRLVYTCSIHKLTKGRKLTLLVNANFIFILNDCVFMS